MPSLDNTFLTLLRDDYKKFPCLIETGTFYGETTFALEPYFDETYTIEFNDKYYNNVKNKYTGNKIKFILGDSSIEFETLLPNITSNCVFFLDGHWSGGDTGHSNKDCPLIEEITHINNLFKNDAIIIIDDFRLFGLNASSGILGEDWSEISKEKILKILNTRISEVYNLPSCLADNDRLIIHINSKKSAFS